ncbi:MAG: peptidoglycan-binding protein [Hyphomonas sp.]
MSQTRPWSVKGIDERAREAAREAATAEGVTLGEYLNRLLIASDPPQPNEVVEPLTGRHRPSATAASDALDRLARRIEATEARSTLAITGMDHTILGLVSRLETTEQASSAIAGHVEGMIDELQETFEALQRKVRRMEEDETPRQNLEALKALEQALGKLASHVYEESDLTHEETQAIKGRVESGFAELNERVETMETRVESTLSEAAKRVERAVEQAELRAEGTAKHLAERMSALETNVHSRLAGVERSDERLDKVEADVSGALESMEGTLLRIQDRLNRAETTTDAALKSLESTFASLDQRIETVASQVDPDLADRLRSEFEARFETIMSSVRETVDTARQELAEEIAQTAGGPDPAFVAGVRETLDDVQTRLTASEERQARAMETVSTQIGRLGSSFDARLRDMEERADADTHETIRNEIERLGHTVSERIDGLADDLSQRVADSEARSASAIEQIGDQVAAATNRLQVRQTEAMRAIADKVDEHRKKADVRLSDALASVSERLEQMQSQNTSALSPVQKAIASLAARLESLEDFTTPPHAPKAMHEAPLAPSAFDQDDAIGDDFGLEEVVDLDLTEDDADTTEDAALDASDDTFLEDAAEEDFEPGLESWDALADAEPSAADEVKDPYRDDFDAIRRAVEKLTLPQADEPELDEAGDLPENAASDDLSDPLGALDGMDDSHTEARESDIFDEDEEFEAFVPPEAELETAPPAPTTMDENTADYLTRARRAALAATSARPAVAAPAKSVRSKAQGSGSKLPLIAGAAAVAVAGAAVGGYLYMRGKQEAPVQNAPASTYVDPGAESEDVAAETAAASPEADLTSDAATPAPASLESELFGDSETAAASEAAVAESEAKSESPSPAPQKEAKADVTPPATVKPAAEAPKPAPAKAATPAYAPIPPVVTVEAAAASGNYIAQYQLGQDRLAAGDLASGADYIRKAAQKGLPIAQYALAKLHEKGTGVPKDLKLAREWTEKAATAGNVKAMHDLAVFMAEGDGGEQTFAGAVEWFRKGAEYGVVDSQYNLGILYEQGLGISPSMTDALFWFEVAKKNGDGGAPAKVAELAAKVSPEAAAQAKARADDWRPASANAIANGRFGAQPWNTGNPLQVQAIQNALNALGFNAGAADGTMGSATAKAIRDYQSANKLDVTGAVTPELVEKLNAGAAPRG